VNKRELNHHYHQASYIKAWQIAVIFLVLLLASVWALRQNSRDLAPIVAAVVEADRQGEGVEEALLELDSYISSHMNTDIDEPIQLAYSYDRAVQKVLDKAKATSDGGIYKKAQAECENPNVVLSVRAACIQDYVVKNSKPGQEPKAVEFPDKSLYTHSFLSPAWSPDLAGWLVILTFLTGLVLISWLAGGWWVKRHLKKHL
jgi:hypothetical protein